MGLASIYENERWGRLVILGEADAHIAPSGRRVRMVRCLCDCGVEKSVRLVELRRGHTSSCGCLHLDKVTKHGHAQHSEVSGTYYVWQNMKRRCTDPTNGKYMDYGGRGIAVCDRWLESFENFLEDMGEKPEGLSLERVENGGNYEPENCVWATLSEQNSNRRSRREIMEDRRKYLG